MTTTGPMPPAHFRPPEPPSPQQRRALPVLLAGCALVVSLLAVGVSLIALSRAGDSGPTPQPVGSTGTASAAAAPEAATPTDALPTGATETTAPTEEPTSEPTDGPDPSGSFTVAYQAEPLRLQPSYQRYVDLDEPSGNAASSAAELTYGGVPGDFKLSFRDLALASVSSPTATANDCAQQLRRAPIDTSFAPSKGQLVCVLTDRDAADDQGIRQKVVLIKVDSIADDGTLNLTLTAWTVPR